MTSAKDRMASWRQRHGAVKKQLRVWIRPDQKDKLESVAAKLEVDQATVIAALIDSLED
jgi:hypothetical protein